MRRIYRSLDTANSLGQLSRERAVRTVFTELFTWHRPPIIHQDEDEDEDEDGTA